MKKIIASPLAPKAVGPYSQAVEANGTLSLSGQLPIDGATGTMPEGIEAQTRQSLTNIGHILAEAGYEFKDVVNNGNKYVALRKSSNLKEVYIVRYADDCNIFVKSEVAANRVMIEEPP